ncbi:hypothetical protein ARMGADRAFT_941031 [Armillaria gallica]|uniref:Uncharacterized protein n=1 Tax=Armillaria gallica TaxID=47427 RepID=A0A2H3CT05_ARMGA|nr:hypothetical protein ARMGADRAFT_941031 [Armillaria gallica]
MLHCCQRATIIGIYIKNTDITSSKVDRINIASAALEKAISMLQGNGQFNGKFFSDAEYEIPGRLYAQMAEFDRLTNQTKYKDALKQYFASAELVRSGYLDELNYGYAAAHAYAAYRDPYFLDLAVTSWTSARQYTISDQQAASGTIDSKKVDITMLCQGTTLAGGTYWVSNN